MALLLMKRNTFSHEMDFQGLPVSISLKIKNLAQQFCLESDNMVSKEGMMSCDADLPFTLFSYVAGLYELEKLFCSGAYISPRHIVTTAMCLKRYHESSDTNKKNYYARMGIFGLLKSNTRYTFKNVKIHNKYNFTTEDLPDNVGLITVFTSIYIFQHCIQFIFLF